MNKEIEDRILKYLDDETYIAKQDNGYVIKVDFDIRETEVEDLVRQIVFEASTIPSVEEFSQILQSELDSQIDYIQVMIDDLLAYITETLVNEGYTINDGEVEKFVTDNVYCIFDPIDVDYALKNLKIRVFLADYNNIFDEVGIFIDFKDAGAVKEINKYEDSDFMKLVKDQGYTAEDILEVVKGTYDLNGSKFMTSVAEVLEEDQWDQLNVIYTDEVPIKDYMNYKEGKEQISITADSKGEASVIMHDIYAEDGIFVYLEKPTTMVTSNKITAFIDKDFNHSIDDCYVF